MAKLVIDPITRIEGHLRIEAVVEGGRVKEAWSSGTMFRGVESILSKIAVVSWQAEQRGASVRQSAQQARGWSRG